MVERTTEPLVMRKRHASNRRESTAAAQRFGFLGFGQAPFAWNVSRRSEQARLARDRSPTAASRPTYRTAL